MAGAPNTTSPSTGASAWKCSAKSRDLSNAGPFNDQPHSLGPTLFYNPGEEGRRKGRRDERIAEAAAMELSLNVGVQFGLTDASSDMALKFQGSLSF